MKTTVTGSYSQVPGSLVEFRFVVTSVGTRPVAGPIVIDDSMTADESCPPVSSVGNRDGDLDPGESITCTGTYRTTSADVEAGSIRNRATASGGGGAVTSEDAVVVPMAPTIAVLLDRSGSMEAKSIRRLNRYNRLLAELRDRYPDSPYHLTLFNSFRSETRYDGELLRTIPDLTMRTFKPVGHTPLYDAAADAIRALLAEEPIGKVTFVIATDGVDNRSVRETQRSLARLIVRMEKRYDWTFLYRGAQLTTLKAEVTLLEDHPELMRRPDPTPEPASEAGGAGAEDRGTGANGASGGQDAPAPGPGPTPPPASPPADIPPSGSATPGYAWTPRWW